MGFGWSGTFRQGQWKTYRSFILRERKDVSRRLAVIQAELQRIGEVRVYFQRKDGQVTEQREGIWVAGGSSLEKLLQAYVAQGGNPFDISLFLTPDSTLEIDGVEFPTQPYGGVIYPQEGTYTFAGSYQGGYLTVRKYIPRRIGGRRVLDDRRPATVVDASRRWVAQTIQHRVHNLEARILKLCDLREQLLAEVQALQQAVGGTVSTAPALDLDFFAGNAGVVPLVYAIDRIFYPQDASTGKLDRTKYNNKALAYYPSLLQDLAGEEDNTAL